MFGGLTAAVASVLMVLPFPPGPVAEGGAAPTPATTASVPFEAPGAAALKGPTWGTVREHAEEAFTHEGLITPDGRQSSDLDEPPYYDDGCHAHSTDTEPGEACVYGDPDGERDVWVLGDSKVGQWFTALDTIAQREGWRLTVHTRSACAYVPTLALAKDPRCETFNDHVDALLQQDPPDLVITASGRRGTAFTRGYVDTWNALAEHGTQVVAMWDSHSPQMSVPGCLEPLVPLGDYLTTCSYEPGVSANATLQAAVAQVSSASYVDMADWVCPASMISPRCPSVIGQAMVYRAGSHLTDTYVATLTDALHERLYRSGVAASPPEPERVERVGGVDRYDTAALLARDATLGGQVFLASGENFPDALSAAALAGDVGAPVLLTQGDELPEVTRDALRDLRPRRVTVVGGDGVVSDAVLDEVRFTSGASVERVSGKDRYATAAGVAHRFGSDVPMVYVATGDSFPDALAAAARAGHEGVPVVLTRTHELPAVTAEVLAHLRPRAATVVGGDGVVGDAVVHELEQLTTTRRVARVAGTDRYATAALLAAGYPSEVGSAYVATGQNFPDALAAAARAGHEGAPVLLVQHDTLPDETAEALELLRPQRFVAVGSDGVIAEDVRWSLEQFLR